MDSQEGGVNASTESKQNTSCQVASVRAGTIREAYVCLKTVPGQCKVHYRKALSTCARLLPKGGGRRSMLRSHQSNSRMECEHGEIIRNMTEKYLEVTSGIKEKVFRLDVTMCNTLAMEVGHSVKNLLEATFHFTWAHSTGKGGIVSIECHMKADAVSELMR